MKIILDNIKFSTTNQGGISNYWYELSKYLLETNTNVFFYENSKAISNFHRSQLKIPQDRIILDNKSYFSSIHERVASVNIKSSEEFIFHSSYYRTLANNKFGKEITTVHDFTHNFHSTLLKKHTHNYIKYNSIKKAEGIICISENTYNDLLKFCPPQKHQKVVIIHNGVSNNFHVLDEASSISLLPLGLEKNGYILYVGSRQNYKNFIFVINIIKETIGLKLVIIGEELNKKEKSLFGEHISRVSVLTNINNFDLNVLYNNALTFIYPSSYEGFGIPIIEAMKAGCPVIALNNSSIPEVSGNAAFLLDSLDVSKVKKHLIDLEVFSIRKTLIEKGIEQSKKFSWEKCTKETKEFYEEVF